MAACAAFSLFVGDYRIEPDIKLGSGSNAIVHLAHHLPTNSRVAVKIFDISDSTKRKFALREVQILRSLTRHDNIIDLHDVIEEREFLYMFLEYAPNGHMSSFIHRHGRLDEEKARKFFVQILSALEYCHVNNVVHHDMKLENILLASDHSLRLIDFGLSRRMSKSGLIKEFAGSPLYMPPEVFSLQLHNEKVDIWGLGVCLYYMVTDTFPFPANTYHELEEKVLFEEVVFPQNMGLSENVKDLIRSMLAKDPSKRLTVKEIKNHGWLSMTKRRILKKRTSSSSSSSISFDDFSFEEDSL